MKKVGQLLQKSIKKAGLNLQLEAYEVLETFSVVAKEVLPKQIFPEIRPISFRGGVLKVQCSHPAFAMQLKSYERPLRAKINRYLGKEKVSQFVFIS